MKDSVDLSKVNMRELLKNMGVNMKGGHDHSKRQGMGSPLDHLTKSVGDTTYHFTGDSQPGFGFNKGDNNGKFYGFSGLANYRAQENGGWGVKGCSTDIESFKSKLLGGRRTKRKGKSSKRNRSTRRRSTKKYGGYGDSMSCKECSNNSNGCACNVRYGFTGSLNNFNLPKWECAGCGSSGVQSWG